MCGLSFTGRELDMSKDYICGICGYVYQQNKGDQAGGIAPGTAFEDIPDEWVCPLCEANKSEFNEV